MITKDVGRAAELSVESGHDRRRNGSRRTFLKGVGLVSMSAMFGSSFASPVGAVQLSVPAVNAALSYLPLETEFEQTYGYSGAERFNGVVQANDGGYVLAGSTRSFGGGLRGYVVKTDEEGTVEWEWWDTETNPSVFHSVVALDNGYLFGGNADATNVFKYDYWLRKTDFDGNEVFSKTYAGPGGFVNAWSGGIPTADGGYAVAGEAAPSGKFVDFYLVKTDSNGDKEWAKSYGGTGYESGTGGVLQTADGGFLLAGRKGPSLGPPFDIYLVKTDADGDVEWTKSLSEPGNQDVGEVVAVADGYLLAGYTNNATAGSYDFYLVKVDLDGNVVWKKKYGGSGDDRASSIVGTADGGYALAGYTQSFGAGGWDGWFVKVDEDGTEQTTAVFGGADADLLTGDLVQTDDFGYALAGLTRSSGAGDSDGWLVKTGPVTFEVDVEAIAPIRTTGSGAVPVVLYGTADFDVTTVDASTVWFDAADEVDPDAERGAQDTSPNLVDQDEDGFPDLLFGFPLDETHFERGDTEATLVGRTTDGFGIEGNADVRIVGPPERPGRP